MEQGACGALEEPRDSHLKWGVQSIKAGQVGLGLVVVWFGFIMGWVGLAWIDMAFLKTRVLLYCQGQCQTPRLKAILLPQLPE